MTQDVPLIDIAGWHHGSEADRDAIAEAVRAACEEWGFFLLTGHGIDPTLTRDVADVSRAFFDLPVEEKLKSDGIGRKGSRGYFRMESKSLARTQGDRNAPGDLRESFRTGAVVDAAKPATMRAQAAPHFMDNVWPSQPAAMRTLWTDYFEACEAVCGDVLRICARALKLPDTYFDDKIDASISSMTAQHYPALEKAPVPGQIRSGAHTDFGTLTLLLAEDKPGGLQVMGRDGKWHDVKPVPGAYIVNLGDMMAQWTNDRWRSTLHRVVNPPSDAGAAARRLSIVFFHTPNHDAMIACIPSCADADHPPKYAPISSGDHLAAKLRAVETRKTD